MHDYDIVLLGPLLQWKCIEEGGFSDCMLIGCGCTHHYAVKVGARNNRTKCMATTVRSSDDGGVI